jgi:hypothetical protein
LANTVPRVATIVSHSYALVATCHTSVDNLAMIRTAETVDFHQIGNSDLESVPTQQENGGAS